MSAIKNIQIIVALTFSAKNGFAAQIRQGLMLPPPVGRDWCV